MLRLASRPGRGGGSQPLTETPTSRTAHLNAFGHVDLRRSGGIGTPHGKGDNDADEDQGDTNGTGNIVLHKLVLGTENKEMILNTSRWLRASYASTSRSFP